MPKTDRTLPPKQIIQAMSSKKKFSHKKKPATAQALEQILRVVDPGVSGFFPQYKDDWGRFIEEELGDYVPDTLDELIRVIMNHRITVVKSGTGLGKSWTGSRIVLAFYKIYEECQIYMMAAPPKGNLINNLISKVRSAVFKNKGLFAKDEVKALTIMREPEQFIEGLVIPTTGTEEEKETRFSGKHAPHMLIILDEGDAIPNFVFSAVDGWGSGGITFRIVVFFNPKEKTGAAYDLIERSESDPDIAVHTLCAFDHVNVVTGRQVIPGAVSRSQTVKRTSEWCRRATPDEAKKWDRLAEDGLEQDIPADAFELPEYLVGESYGEYPQLRAGWYRVLKAHPEYSYKVLGRYPVAGMAASIPEEWLRKAMQRFDKYGGSVTDDMIKTVPCVMGIDVADTGEDHHCRVLRWGGVYSIKKWRHGDASDAIDKMIDTWHVYEPEKTVVDRSGVGAMAPGTMAKANCERVYGFLSQKKSKRKSKSGRFAKKRDEALWGLREWFNPSNGHMPQLDKSDRRLVQSLRALKHEVINDNITFITKKKIKENLGYSPDEMDALMLTMVESGTTFRSID